MKVVFAFLLLGVTLVLGHPFYNRPHQAQTKGWYVPQFDGTSIWMTEKEAMDAARESTIESRATKVKFYLYTSANPSSPELINSGDQDALKNSRFNSRNPTRFIIHGWQNNYNSDVNIYLRNALFNKGTFNVISVDWSSGAETINYPGSVLRVSGVGQTVAGFIDFLNQYGGMSFNDLHVMGHSLGAHVSGYAGKNVRRGRINTIIGLDPALPLFSYNSPNSRLSSDDATYVESIQTNGGGLGFLEPIGRAAFYPNGGKSQPGCGLDVSGACAHSRSFEYYAESITKNDFPSVQCNSYQSAVGNSCGNTYSSVKMGAPTNSGSAHGSFYVPVNKKSPYGMG